MALKPYKTLLKAADGEFIVNPTFEELENSDLNLTLAGTADYILMVEAGADEVPEEDIIAHNGWDGETFVTEYERQDGTIYKYIDHWNEDVDVEFTVPGLDGFLFGYRNGGVCHACMTEPDGSEWTCDYGMEYGAGFMD